MRITEDGKYEFLMGEVAVFAAQHPDLKFAYICDRFAYINDTEACKRCGCGECCHTEDYNHALFRGYEWQLFEKLDDTHYMEVFC